jgi:hypothetical protein
MAGMFCWEISVALMIHWMELKSSQCHSLQLRLARLHVSIIVDRMSATLNGEALKKNIRI